MGKKPYLPIYTLSTIAMLVIHHFGISKIPIHSTWQLAIDMAIFTLIMGWSSMIWERLNKNKKRKK